MPSDGNRQAVCTAVVQGIIFRQFGVIGQLFSKPRSAPALQCKGRVRDVKRCFRVVSFRPVGKKNGVRARREVVESEDDQEKWRHYF